MKEIKKEFKWFWAWNDEKEEQWLTEMAQQGWHLQSPCVFGAYTFEKGVPRNVVYRLDFKTVGKDMDDYLQLFADGGWEHLGAMGGWQYFRKEAVEGEAVEIYTDNASKIQKYQRLLLFLVVLLLPIYTLSLFNLGTTGNLEGFLAGFTGALNVVMALLLLLYVYALVRILRRIGELKK